jgi:hypothetical protein
MATIHDSRQLGCFGGEPWRLGENPQKEEARKALSKVRAKKHAQESRSKGTGREKQKKHSPGRVLLILSNALY